MIAKQHIWTVLMWTHYFQTCTYAYNSFVSPVLNGLSSFQVAYDRPPKVLLQIETNPQEGTSGSFKEYNELMKKRFAYFKRIVQDYRVLKLDMINKDKPMTQYKPEYLVTSFHPKLVYLKPAVKGLKLVI